jgi:prolyl-tRNA synthetase
MSKLVGRCLKETPRDAQSPSHILLIRGGYIRPVSAGIYSLLPLGKRIIDKVERIVREEMDRIDGQEILMPVVQPRELWQQSGRDQAIGAELLRFKDRNQKDMVLAMTHEESTVLLVKTEVNSYKQLPMMVYHLQTKYRDEARPRAGLIRVREFTMKDAYSFHESNECLAAYYERVHEAYERIFRRVGMTHVVSIQADSGMMGGSGSHEFMAVTESGEDTIFLSPDDSYRANRDIACTGLTFSKDEPLPLEKVHTPGQKSIDEVSAFVGVETTQTGKAVFYTYPDGDKDQLVFAVIRGDIEVNEVKLRNHLKTSALAFATDAQIEAIGSTPGYASPMGIDAKNVRVIFDPSAVESSNLVVGANEVDYHYKNFNYDRDIGDVAEAVEVVDIATARAGDPCPLTGEPLLETRGIEVGNIFQLGTKYTEAMDCHFLDVNGKAAPMIMGCYGIGIGRAMASVCEQCHDDYGPIWPVSIAPYQVHVCALNFNKDGVREAAEQLYADLQAAGLEVLFDDRNAKAGFAFNDADLIGIPFRLIISPKTVAEGQVEFKKRDSGRDKDLLALSDAVATVKAAVDAALAEFE